jgi:TonB family protein
MVQSLLSQKSFLGLVVLMHLTLLFSSRLLKPSYDNAVPIKLTFTKIGGGSGKALTMAPKKVQEEVVVKKKIKPRHNILAEKIVKAAKVEETNPSVETTEVGNGMGSGTGTGIGNGSGSGEGSVDPLKIYGSRVAELLNQNKIYPAMAKRLEQQGRVLLKITVDKSGKLLDLEMLKESPFGSLNEAALQMVKKVEQFPPLPNEISHEVVTFNVPVEYKLR